MSRCSRCVVGFVAALFVAVAGLALPALARNPCADGGSPRPVTVEGPAAEGGITGTGHGPTVEGGIGGTGHAPREGGIGGTGILPADTGIVGTVTGFGSICVQGIEIHCEADTVIEVDGRSATADDLAVGQVVEVVAAGFGDEVTAHRIVVRHELSGPVTDVDAAANRLFVLGQPVALSETTRTLAEGEEVAAEARAFAPGSFVDVSGMRRADGTLVASRISVVPERVAVNVSGSVQRRLDGSLAVGGTPIRAGDDAVDFDAGAYVRVRGSWNGKSVAVADSTVIPALPFEGRVRRLELEGYLYQRQERQIRVGPWTIELAEGAAREFDKQPVAIDKRVQMNLSITADRRLLAERLGPARPLIRPVPMRPRERVGPEDTTRGGRGVPGDDRPAAQPPRPGVDATQRGSDTKARPPLVAPRPPAGGDVPRPQGVVRPEAPARPQRPNRVDRVEPPVRPERPDVPERPDIPDRPDVPDRPDRPERPEKPHRPDRLQPPDRPRPPARPDFPRRGLPLSRR
jgi:hypothetical protein